MTAADEATAKEVIAAFEAGDWGLGLSLLATLKARLALVTDETRLGAAIDVIRDDYHATRDNIVKEFVREWRAGEFNGSREDAFESLEQTCDNACMYTQTSQLYLATSRFDDAYLSEFGELPIGDGTVQWSAMAAVALKADVLDSLQREDIDTSEDPPDEATEECKGCDEWKVVKDGFCEDCTDNKKDDDDGVEDDNEHHT